MKRISLAILATGVCLAVIQNANASLLFSDGFNYTSGDNLGGAGSSTVPPYILGADPAASQLSIGAVNLTYTGLADLGGNSLTVNSGVASTRAATSLGSSITSGSVYYSFLIEATSLPTANSYLTALTTSGTPQANGNTTDAIDLYAKNSGAGWVLGERTTGVSASYESTVLSLNTVYFAVMKYTFGASTPTAQLFFSPTPGGSEPGSATVSLTGTANVANISDLAFRAQATAAVGNFIFDDVRVGTTWEDVTPTVPEPTTFALAGVGMLGLIMTRRNRR